MKKAIIISTLLALSVAGHAQVPLLDGKIRAGYSWSNRFTNNNNDRVRLSGLELGADIPLSGLIPTINLSFSPSIMFGGALSRGSDADGTVYRLQVLATTDIPMSDLYAGFGLGYSFAQARGGQFNDFNAFSTRILAGYRLSGFGPLNAALELAWHNASKGALSGWTIGIAVGF